MYVELRLLVELSCKTSGPWALGPLGKDGFVLAFVFLVTKSLLSL